MTPSSLILTGLFLFFAGVLVALAIVAARRRREPGGEQGREWSESEGPAAGDYFHLLAENSLDLITVIDVNGIIRYITPSVQHHLGYQAAELVGQNGFDLIHPDDLSVALAELNLVLRQSEQAQLLELRLRHQNGSWWPFELAGANLLSEPTIQGIVITARSLLQRKQEERERKAVVTLAEAMREAPTREALVTVLLRQLLQLMDASGAALAVRDPINDEIVIEQASGLWANWAQERIPPGTGVSGYVMSTRELYHTENALADPFFARPEMLNGLSVVASAPMLLQDECIGVLFIGREEPMRSGELKLLSAITDMSASALNRATLHDQTQRRVEQLTIINQLGRLLSENPELPEIYRAISNTVHRLLPDISSLLVAAYDADQALITAIYGVHEGEETDVTRLPPAPLAAPGQGMQSEVIRSRQAMIVNDFQKRLQSSQTVITRGDGSNPVRAALYAPMITGTQVKGVMQVQSYTLNRFTQMDLEFLSLIANTAAIAIQNGFLLANLQQSNAELQQMATELRHLIDNANAPIFGIDADGKVNEWNKAAERLTGYRKEDVLGQDLVAELIPETNQLSIKAVLENALQGEETANYELTVSTQRGESVLVLLNATARRNAAGEITGVLGVGQDITERKRAEEALRYSEATNRALLDTIPDLLFRVSQSGIILDVRSGSEELPVRREQLIGRNIKELIEQIKGDTEAIRRRLLGAFTRVLVTGESQVEAYEQQTAEGDTVYYESRFIPGNRNEVLLIIRDITEQKQAEEAIRQTQKLESIGLLAGGVAHDFNNLLTGMLGQTSLAMAKLSDDHRARPHIEKAVLSAQRAADLTRQLLAYAGKGKFRVEPIDLNRLIRENEGLLETILPKRVSLHLNLAPDLPLFQADRGQVQQVVMNLVMNAAESIRDETGHVHVRTYLCELGGDEGPAFIGDETLPAGPYSCLEVGDTGSGMNQATLDRIFDPFFSTKESGRGLGLSATLGIIRAHGGGLQVESRLGQGSVFQVCFPASDAKPQPQPSHATPTTNNVAGMVLVIDDEEPVREAIVDILDIVGLQVITADNGRTGLDLFRRHQTEIGVVLLDMQMPVMGGEETFHALRSIDPQVKVILSSGYSEAEATRSLVGQGIGAFLQKPYSIETLIEHVQLALQAAPKAS